MTGIYFIKCTENNKIYVGSSINIEKRLKTHFSQLNKNIHKNSHLQASYNKYGKDKFSSGTLETCSENLLLTKENYYIENYNSLSSDYGYNKVIAERNDNIFCNSSYIEKLSKIKKGITPKNFEFCKKMLERPILEYENGNFIREYSSAKEASKTLNIDSKQINNILRKRVKKNKMYPNKTFVYKDGLPTRKIKYNPKSNIKKGKYKIVVQTSYSGEIINKFLSLDDASEKLQISRNTIINSCNNDKKRCTKLKCKFKYEQQ